MNSPIKLAILDMYKGAPNQGMRCIHEIIEAFRQSDVPDLEVEVFDVRGKAQVPDLSFDIYISTGGPDSPLPSSDEWERLYFNWFDSLLKHNTYKTKKKFVFLICHSFQMVAQHLGIGRVTKRRSTSFGTFPIHKTDHGKQEQFFSNLPDPFWAVDSRDYQLVEANWEQIEKINATVLCREKIRHHVPLERAIMAVRFTPEVFGTQFHPEADAAGMVYHFSHPDIREKVIANHGQQKFNDMIEHLNDKDKILLTESVIIPTFLRNATEQLIGELA